MIWTCGEAVAIRMISSFVIAMGATGTVIAEPLNAPEGKAKAKDDSMATVGALASEDMAVGGASCLDCHTAIDCLRCERCGQKHRRTMDEEFLFFVVVSARCTSDDRLELAYVQCIIIIIFRCLALVRDECAGVVGNSRRSLARQVKVLHRGVSIGFRGPDY